MGSRLLAPVLGAALLTLAGCDLEDWGGASERHTRDFHYEYPLSSDGRLTVEGFNGSIEVSGWDQDRVDVSGTKFAPSPDMLESLKIDVQQTSGAVYIRAVRPSSPRGNLGVKFVIKAPRKVQLERIATTNGSVRALDTEGPARLKTTNGSIRGQNLRGPLDAQTTNGSVEVNNIEGAVALRTSNGRVRAEDVRGTLEAATTNGSIHVRLARVDAGRTVRVETTNGGIDLTLPRELRSDVRAHTTNSGITLHLPENLNARVSARTSSSSISSDFEVRTPGERSKHKLEGSIGSGGPLLDLSTTNGSIKLLRM